MLLQNKRIAIIGAGPVGLTMAKLLQQKGANVSVYERDKDAGARIWGGTLDLHENSGQKAMKEAGLLENYFAAALPMGRILADERGNVFLSGTPQYDCPEINRNDLRKMLLESLAGNTVHWDKKFTDLEARNGEWLLYFEDGTTANADFVIGANGGMSGVRKHITDAAVEYTGTFIIQGYVSQPAIKCSQLYERCNNNIMMVASEGITFVANPKNNGALTYNVTFRKPEEWLDNGLDFQNTETISTFLSNMLPHWHECYKQLFRSTSSFAGLPARKLPLDKPWKTDRPLPITLIGDAAHLMPPFAGQGVNTGLMDALILSDNLTNRKFETIQAAINDYEQQMLVYAKAAQLETSTNEAEMHRPDFSFTKRLGN